MKSGFNKFNPFMRNRGGGQQQQRQTPLYTVPNTNQNNPDDSSLTTNETVFVTDIEPGSFIGWKLYFPDKGEFELRSQFYKSQFQFISF